jgi:hypothetical protein
MSVHTIQIGGFKCQISSDDISIPDGWELTGEYRKPTVGDFFLYTDSDQETYRAEIAEITEVQQSYKYNKQLQIYDEDLIFFKIFYPELNNRYFIIRKTVQTKPTIDPPSFIRELDIYTKEYRYTGEFRTPYENEPYACYDESTSKWKVYRAFIVPEDKRFIYKEFDCYARKPENPQVPAGWKLSGEFKAPNRGDYFLYNDNHKKKQFIALMESYGFGDIVYIKLYDDDMKFISNLCERNHKCFIIQKADKEYRAMKFLEIMGLISNTPGMVVKYKTDNCNGWKSPHSIDWLHINLTLFHYGIMDIDGVVKETHNFEKEV